MPEITAELHIRPLRAVGILAATIAWTAWIGGTLGGVIATGMPFPVLLGVPLAFVGLLITSDETDPILRLCAGWTILVLTASVAAPLIVAAPLFALSPIALVASAALCSAFPATTAVALFALTGIYGSVLAFTGLSSTVGADALLGGMWLGLVLARLAGGRLKVGVLWPAVLLIGAYVAVTAVYVLSADSLAPAFLSFRLSTWYLLAMLLVAYAGWTSVTYAKIARGAVVVGGLVGAYATLRWLIGPASAEEQFAAQVGGAFNFVEGELRTFGSFGSGHQLGFWTAVVAPFCLAAALGWRGRWKWIAALAFAALVFAVLASEVRGAFIGLVLGVAIVLVLYQLASSTPTLDFGRSFLVGFCCLAALTGALLLTTSEGSGGGLDRYDAILNPSEDAAFLRREQKLAAVLPEIREQPLGHGLGTASLNSSLRPPYLTVAALSLDNSFLRIAYEQGLPAVLLFAVALAALGARLSIGALRAASRDAASMGIGAAGALGSTAVLFYSGMYNEDLLVLGAWMLIGLGMAFVMREESTSASNQVN
jgi:hypothetical protein